MDIVDVILASLGSIFTFICAQKWIFPLFGKIWCWLKDRKKELDEHNIDATESILDIKKGTIEVTEKQFELLLNQISRLEEELQSYSNELQKLRTTILRLNAKLYDKSLLLSKLQKKCCDRVDCKDRIVCKNYLCEIIDKEEDN